MKTYSVVTDTTTEASGWIPGWYHSEFQKNKLHFSVEFNHFVGNGGGKCNWVWFNYPLEETIELFSDRTLYTETDTAFQLESLLNYFNIEKYEKPGHSIAFLISQKPGVSFQYTREYYKFTVKITTDDGIEMEDSCIVKIVD